jgi:hypothetical protein
VVSHKRGVARRLPDCRRRIAMYEPSEEIKKQIAKENWEILRPGEDWETGGDIRLAFLMVADETVKCPIIKKALELLETKPQWQDKPDKAGWWWQDVEAHLPRYRILKVAGKLGGMRVLVTDYPTLEDYLASYDENDKIKFLYIPEPEPYEEETRNV